MRESSVSELIARLGWLREMAKAVHAGGPRKSEQIVDEAVAALRQLGQDNAQLQYSLEQSESCVSTALRRLEAAEQDGAKLDKAIAEVLEGFERGIFVRSIGDDANASWAIKLFPYIRALGILQAHLDAARSAATDAETEPTT